MKKSNKMFAAVAALVIVCGSVYVYNHTKTLNQAAEMYGAHLNNDKAAFIEAYKKANKSAVSTYKEWIAADMEEHAAAMEEDARATAEAAALFDGNF